MVFKIVFYALVIAYAVLMMIAGTVQFKNKSVSMVSPLIMIFGSLLLFSSTIMMYLNRPFTLMYLIAGLVFIHISAVINGMQMHGKLTYKHHFLRVMLSMVLISLALI